MEIRPRHIAVIPARGGSERIPRKNIKLINGKPAISYAINVARQSEIFDKIFVSTDDSEIAMIAQEYGAEILYLRSAKISDSFSTTLDVMADFVKIFSEQKSADQYIVSCIYPVVPLLSEIRIRDAEKIFLENECKYVLPLLPLSASPTKCFTLSDNSRIKYKKQSGQFIRSQDLEQYFYDAGQFYIASASTWLARVPIFSENSIGLVLNKWEVIDVDTQQDWEFMEQLVKLQQVRGKD
jgi:pseudaminic acid cytidylyltransferase